MTKRRAELEMVIDLLNVIQKKPYFPRTRQCRLANLNVTYTKERVTKLVEVGFITNPEEKRRSFSITKKGEDWLWQMKKLISLYRGDNAK